MTNRHRPDQLDRLMAGELDDDVLAALLSRARDVLPAAPEGEVASRHVAATAHAAAAHADAAPATVAAPSWRRRLAHVFGYTATKVALGLGVAAAATGGLAATESFPDPVQRVVSTGASYIGLDLPHPADRLADPETPVVELPTGETGLPEEPPADDRADDRADDTQGAQVEPPVDEPGPPDHVPVDDVPAGDLAEDQDTESPPADTPAEDRGQPAGTPPGGQADEGASDGDEREPDEGPGLDTREQRP